MDHIWTSDGNYKCSKKLTTSPDLAKTLGELFNLREMESVDECYNFEHQQSTIKTITQSDDVEIKKALDEYKGQLVEATIKCLDKDTKDLPFDQKGAKEVISYEEFVCGLKSTGNMPENATEAYLRKMYDSFHKDHVGSGSTLTYNWEDESDLVSVYVPIPITAKKDSIKSALTTTTWKLSVNGKEIINGELSASVKADDSYWAIEAPGMLCMTFEKVRGDKTWKVSTI